MTEPGRTPLQKIWLSLPLAGVLCLLISFVWALVLDYFSPGCMALAGLGIAFFFCTFVRLEAANLKYYLNEFFYVSFVLGTCVVLFLVVRQHDSRWDLTQKKLHTLSGATEKYLRLLKKDVEIVVFDGDVRPYEDLLNRYSAVTPRVKWMMKNPRSDPDFTREFDRYVLNGIIYVRYGDEQIGYKKKRLTRDELSEDAVTNAIVEVTRERKIKIYFLTGHQELGLTAPPAGASPSETVRSMSGFGGFLAGRALEVEPLDLTERSSVPKDATMIVVAGPAFDLHDAEARELDRWLSGGGKMLVLFDLPTLDASVSFTNLATLLRKRGLDDNGLMILDYLGLRRKNQLSAVALLSYSPSHMITAPLGQSADLIFVPKVRALTPVQPLLKGLKIEALVGSSPDAWTSPWHEEAVAPPRAGERRQQIVGWAMEETGQGRSGMRLAVYGTSEFVKNRFWAVSQTSRNLMLNTVNWLIEQEDLISVPPRTVEGTPLELDDEELRLVFILIVLALPALLFFGGVTYARVIRRG